MIVGAGLAGLICAHSMPRETVVEIQPEPDEVHKALLRFRSTAVADLTGIEFRAVEVRKGIWEGDGWQQPNIRAANLYSVKCLDRMIDRSIWNLDPVVRYIAPPNFYERLIESVGSRIKWGMDWRVAQAEGDVHAPIISTAPLDAMLGTFDIKTGEKFERAVITVKRYRVYKSDVHQTVYFPSTAHSLYRASITGDLMICEFSGEPDGPWWTELRDAFGVCPMDLKEVETTKQSYGKIAPIDNGKRCAAIARLSQDFNIFSVGRFATWRNILLDDVVKDAAIVKRLIRASAYDRKLKAAGEPR